MKLLKLIGPMIAILIGIAASLSATTAKVVDHCTSGVACQGNATKSLDKDGVCPACRAQIATESQVCWELKEAKEAS